MTATSLVRRSKATAAAVLFAGLAVAAPSTVEAKKFTTVPPPPPVAANEHTPAELAEAVRIAATPLADSAGATLGKPTCPNGVKNTSPVAAQCVVVLGKTAVAFVVTSDGNGHLVASPLFVVVARRELEAQVARASASAATQADCGKNPVIVVPSGASFECTAAKHRFAARIVSVGQTWTATVTEATGPPPATESPEPSTTAKRRTKKR